MHPTDLRQTYIWWSLRVIFTLEDSDAITCTSKPRCSNSRAKKLKRFAPTALLGVMW